MGTQKRLVLAGLICLFAAMPVFGGGAWFAGAETGYCRPTFDTHYTYVVGTPDNWNDIADGWSAGFIVGREISIVGTVAVSVQGRFAFNRATWRLDNDDVYTGTSQGGLAHLESKVPSECALSAVPKVRLGSRIWLLGELGLGQGHVQIRKDSVTSTRYEYDEWKFGWTAGGGVAIRVRGNLDLTAMCRYTRYQDYTFDSHFPDGTYWETVSGHAAVTSVNFGVQFRIP